MFDEYTYLYVEDDFLSRDAIKMVFARLMGVTRLYIFEDSADFMARVKALPRVPDLIMLDIHVRPCDGFQMLKSLRQEPQYEHTKVVALTASVMNEEISLLKKSGFNGAIGKPISVTNFPDLICRILKGELVWHITEG